MIKVLVADDHVTVRRGLRQILSETPEIVVAGEAATADEVLALVRRETWTVIVLDLKLPGASGLDLLATVRRERPDARVLVLTMYPEEQYAVRALRAGAAGFMTKDAAPELLVEAVQRVAAGGRWVSAELAETLASLLAGEAKGHPHERLSDREFEVFKRLASGRTVSQVADELQLSVKTVSTHRTRILKKMNLTNNAELMRYAMTNGLVE